VGTGIAVAVQVKEAVVPSSELVSFGWDTMVGTTTARASN